VEGYYHATYHIIIQGLTHSAQATHAQKSKQNS
jgi:hypothetical protein